MDVRRAINLVESARLPSRSFKTLWHVGTLDPTQKGQGSYEGAGLSVSLHPDAWRRIARGQVGGETWQLTKADNRFLDAHRLSEPQRAMIEDWAVAQGHAERSTVYRVRHFDDELDSEVYSDFPSRERAEAEAEAYEDDAQVEEIPGQLTATAKLRAATRNPNAVTNVFDLILSLYAEEHGYDGVWWNDRLDPSRYSAPRGVIVPSKLPDWSVTRVS